MYLYVLLFLVVDINLDKWPFEFNPYQKKIWSVDSFFLIII